MGAFADWQARYAEHSVATFPVAVDGRGKKPAVKGYLTIGSRVSAELAIKFADAEAFGFALGRRSGITVLDVDTPDEKLLADALDRHGQTPMIVRSGSGNYQAWYRHNGERRQVRPWGQHVPIDVLGGGFVVAPPSLGAHGRYSFIQGTLDDLGCLPHLAGIEAVHERAWAAHEHSEATAQGTRNKSLWRFCMAKAHGCANVDHLLQIARQRNSQFPAPVDDTEVLKIARSAWTYEERGENWIGIGRFVRVDHSLIDELLQENPDAFVLLMMLRRQHWGREFVVANEMAAHMPGGGWRRQRFADARKFLEDAGYLDLVKSAGWHGPPLYRLGVSTRVSKFAHQ